MSEPKTNVLYFADNLEVLRRHIPDSSIDLIYLDPPFGTNRDRNIDGAPGSKQPAFSDSWSWNKTSEGILNDIERRAPPLVSKIRALVETAHGSPLAAYLVMMTPRLLELHRVLKDTGSLYLHCDPTSSHYLKLVLDGIFGSENFRNEIIWSYRGGGRSKRYFARKHDTILFYTRSDSWTFNYQDVLVDRTNQTYFTDVDGRRYWLKYGRKYYLKFDGKVPEDWWADIDPLHGPYRERLGYPTQKPLALLERIIRASSNEGDIVLDPFCGSGTALVAARKLGRRWVGIDNSDEAIEVTSARLCLDRQIHVLPLQ